MNFLTAHRQYPAPFDRPASQRPAPFNVQTDVDRVLLALGVIPQLSAAGSIVALEGPRPGMHLPADLGVPHYVAKDTIAVLEVRNNETLCTSGLTDTVLFTARGATARGHAVIAMANLHSSVDPASAIEAMRRTMAAAGATHYTTLVFGGELSRDPARPSPSIRCAIALAAAAHHEHTLVCGRVGVRQQSSSKVLQAHLGDNALPALPGLTTRKICAVLTGHGLYHARENAAGSTLFLQDRVVFTGVPVDAVAPAHSGALRH
jgi:hypothetical protein